MDFLKLFIQHPSCRLRTGVVNHHQMAERNLSDVHMEYNKRKMDCLTRKKITVKNVWYKVSLNSKGNLYWQSFDVCSCFWSTWNTLQGFDPFETLPRTPCRYLKGYLKDTKGGWRIPNSCPFLCLYFLFFSLFSKHTSKSKSQKPLESEITRIWHWPFVKNRQRIKINCEFGFYKDFWNKLSWPYIGYSSNYIWNICAHLTECYLWKTLFCGRFQAIK